MTENRLGFALWAIFGCLCICLGIYSLFSKKAVGFWANAKLFEVKDIRKYNASMAKLFCIYGMVFIVLGLPLLAEQNTAVLLVSVAGAMAESIAAMIVYTLVIEKKYRKN